MPVRDASLHLRVVDEKGAERAPGAGDKVTVNGTTLAYDATDGFVHKITASGNLAVIIAYKGFAELRQWFEAEAPAERPKLGPFWPGSSKDTRETPSLRKAIDKGMKRRGTLLSCMTLLRSAGGAADDRSPTVFTLTATLAPTREYVAVLGADYWEGALSNSEHQHQASLDFDKYSQTFARHLTLMGRLDTSSPFTVLDCQHGVAERWMRAAGHGYLRQYLLLEKDPPPKWPTAQSFRDWAKAIKDGAYDTSKLLGAEDIYGYVSGLGTERPGTVIELSVFSHAWAGGPILFNTDKGDVPKVRAPTDRDMRVYDFIPPNVAKWPNLKAAFASGAEIHVWGCLATTLAHEGVGYLLRGDTADFYWKEDLGDGKHYFNRARVQFILKRLMAVDINYMQAFASHASVTAFGGAPGYGSDHLPYDELKAIPQKLRDSIGASEIMVVNATRRPSSVRRLYASADLGSREFNAFGYMKYPP